MVREHAPACLTKDEIAAFNQFVKDIAATASGLPHDDKVLQLKMLEDARAHTGTHMNSAEMIRYFESLRNAADRLLCSARALENTGM